MKSENVVVGRIYAAKVSGRVVPVRITARRADGPGWTGENVTTGRAILVRSPRRLRYEWPIQIGNAGAVPAQDRVSEDPVKGKEA